MNSLKSIGHNLIFVTVIALFWGYALSFNNATGWAAAASVTGIGLLSALTLLVPLHRLVVHATLTKQPNQQFLQLTLPAKPWINLVTPSLQNPKLALQPTGQPQQWQTTTPLPRGVYDQVTINLQLNDPLHLLVKRRRQTIKTALIVPPVLASAAATTIFEQLAPLIHAAPTNSSEASGFETQDFRPYHPGDPSNQIDWKLSAKQQTPMLRVLTHDEPVPWGWVFFTTTDIDLEARLAAFYTFVQLVGDLPADILLLGTTQQFSASVLPDAFASYQPADTTTVPATALRQHRVVLFGDNSAQAQALFDQLQAQNLQVTMFDWTAKGGDPNASRT
ncbi:DUF58 domain-containing protein [Lactiplantibacillus songbeiensis]|uniref:DUF58 domain-containing protein n=1 Tax=Lactiplantibacillus songbeiensis TaxID=2559920 RepID=A0ABW4C3B4_9LACO|nr:DUF58 domain-containing protein [Lactiplantibacillus songbeiensis]